MDASLEQAIGRVNAWHAQRLPQQAQIVPPEPVIPPAPPPTMPPDTPIGDPQPTTPPAVDPPPPMS